MARYVRRAATLAAVLAVALAAAGCGGAEKKAGSLDAVGPEALDGVKDKVTVEFWHAMKGANEEAIKKLADAYNASQGKVEVKPVFKGTYDEVIGLYKNSVREKNTPELVQVYDIGSRFMIDAKQAVPVYKFVEKDGMSTDDIVPLIANYYSIDGKLWSMPFNSSMPLLYINKEAFDKAGLDPTKPPGSLEEIYEYAKKLTVKDGSGKTTQFGFNAAVYGWFVEQWLAKAGKEYCDNGNGRKGLATRVNFDGAEGVTIAQWWNRIVKDGFATNTGRKTDDAQNAFKSGTVAMHLESTSQLRNYVNAAKNKFTVVTAPFPKVAGGDTGSSIVGGASLWISGAGHSDAEKRATWEFVKFSLKPDQQATWHVGTGYVPVSKKALEEPTAKQWADQFPQFTTAVQEMANAQTSAASAGCILGVMPVSRKSVEEALEQVLGGKPAADALKEAAEKVKKEIEGYNNSVQ